MACGARAAAKGNGRSTPRQAAHARAAHAHAGRPEGAGPRREGVCPRSTGARAGSRRASCPIMAACRAHEREKRRRLP